MKTTFLVLFIALSNLAMANEYSNYSSCMAPRKHSNKHFNMRLNTNKKEALNKLETALAILSVVSVTAIYYTTDNKSFVPYSIPVGLAVGSFTIGILNK